MSPQVHKLLLHGGSEIRVKAVLPHHVFSNGLQVDVSRAGIRHEVCQYFRRTDETVSPPRQRDRHTEKICSLSFAFSVLCASVVKNLRRWAIR